MCYILSVTIECEKEVFFYSVPNSAIGCIKNLLLISTYMNSMAKMYAFIRLQESNFSIFSKALVSRI